MADRRFQTHNARAMTPNEMAIIQATRESQSGHFKAVPKSASHVSAHQSARNDTKSSTLTKSQPDSALTLIRKKEQSLMNCILQDGDVNQMWQAIRDAIEQLPSTDSTFQGNKKLAIGNYYQSGNFCEFQMGMYRSQETEQNLLDFKRMSGDGFVMDSFFRETRNQLKEAEDIIEGMDTEDEDDDDEEMLLFDDFTDSEDEDDSFDGEALSPYLEIGGPLNLENDSSVVTGWIDDIKNRNIEDKNHRMGLMAHNAGFEKNRPLIIEQGGEALKELITYVFANQENAALVRNTAVLLSEVTQNENFVVTDALLNASFEAMANWVPGNGRKTQFRLSESRETVLNIGNVLLTLQQRGAIDVAALKEKAEFSFNQHSTQAMLAFVERVTELDTEGQYQDLTSLLHSIL